MTSKTFSYLQIHTAVLLFGFTAILGRLIHISELSIVWHRLIITCASLLFLPQVWRELKHTDWKTTLQLSGIGILVSLHWVLFYGAVKYSNVSVTLSCMATSSFFTALIEPLFFQKRVKAYEMILGFFILAGIYLIFFFTELYLAGIILGLLAALLAATFATLNKKMVTNQGALSMTFIELGAGWLFLNVMTPLYFNFFPDSGFEASGMDWMYLIILGLLCTTFAFVLSIQALKNLTAFATNLTINLEPIYGIVMAFFIFNEHQEMDHRFYLGTLLILIAIFLHPILEKRFGAKEAN